MKCEGKKHNNYPPKTKCLITCSLFQKLLQVAQHLSRGQHQLPCLSRRLVAWDTKELVRKTEWDCSRGDEDDEAGMEHEANVNDQANTTEGNNGAEAEDDVESGENPEEHADDRDMLRDVGGNDVGGISDEENLADDEHSENDDQFETGEKESEESDDENSDEGEVQEVDQDLIRSNPENLSNVGARVVFKRPVSNIIRRATVTRMHRTMQYQ